MFMCDFPNMNGEGINHIQIRCPFEDCIKIFDALQKIKQLDTMYMCGNLGDPIVAKDTLEIFQILPNIILTCG